MTRQLVHALSGKPAEGLHLATDYKIIVDDLMSGDLELKNTEPGRTWRKAAAVKRLYGKKVAKAAARPASWLDNKRPWRLLDSQHQPWGNRHRKSILGKRPQTPLEAHAADLRAAFSKKLYVYTRSSGKLCTGLCAALMLAKQWLKKMRELEERRCDVLLWYLAQQSKVRAKANAELVMHFERQKNLEPINVLPVLSSEDRPQHGPGYDFDWANESAFREAAQNALNQ